MKNSKELELLISELKKLTENSSEQLAIDELEYKLCGDFKKNPRVLFIDESKQYFNGSVYYLQHTGYYVACYDNSVHTLHIDVWKFYNGNPPAGYDIHHNAKKIDGTFDKNKNNIEDLLLLTKSEHSTLHLNNRPLIEYRCVNCGKIFKSKAPNAKFCCLHCRSTYQRHSENNLVEKECVFCGKKFMTNKSRPTLTCSKECRYKQIWKKIRENK